MLVCKFDLVDDEVLASKSPLSERNDDSGSKSTELLSRESLSFSVESCSKYMSMQESKGDDAKQSRASGSFARKSSEIVNQTSFLNSKSISDMVEKFLEFATGFEKKNHESRPTSSMQA
mmetsp:Transcript_5166/g.7129  ORF Transcript_5166/g.7129 Transcript_5166/m.7129 type:complete len:119 (-) Transcript_5166:1249-1605(-)